MADDGARKPRLSAAMVQRLKADILGGALPPGTRLPTEPGLMTQFGVSRTVVREAIAALSAEGLVVAQQGRGMFVVEELPRASIWRPPHEIGAIPRMMEMYEFRLAWEPEGAALAAIRRTALQEHAIREAHENLARDVHENRFPLQSNHAFHVAVAEATGNSVYVEAVQRFGPQLTPATIFPNLSHDQGAKYFHTVIEEHARIVEAISARQEDEARQAMRDHLSRSVTSFRQEVREAALQLQNAPGA
ncbi:FadR/GntR family transcriptional regulator [Falsirhodobacter sp. 1013]|uniref:FadR/GntR family transcriptional regulator n=1 Tax=Falsirhodobacter sp. 1013 TaxID=3417566 RepID=UPI003EB83C47